MKHDCEEFMPDTVEVVFNECARSWSMSGLDRLRELADELIRRGNYFSNETEIANRILVIADEIEQDGINQLMHYASTIHKPFYAGESVEEWLDRWYLPRPVVDDEHMQFEEDFVFLEGSLQSRVRHMSMNEPGNYNLNGYGMHL